MSDAAQLIARIRKQREMRLELAEGKAVTVRRPAELEMPELSRGISIDQVCRHVVGWDGFTEADLLGAAHASPEPVAFTSELWREVVADRGEWFRKVSEKLIEMVTAHLQAKAEAAKN